MRLSTRTFTLVALAVGFVACGGAPPRDKGTPGRAPPSPCPEEMAYMPASGQVAAYCIDRYEASLVEVLPEGREVPFSPYETLEKRVVRAVSKRGVVPQGYLSRNEAEGACKRAEKRLCTEAEWVHACRGATKRPFPYGSARRAGACNDRGRAPLALVPSPSPDPWITMNDPRLNQQPGTVAKTGAFAECVSEAGVYDMVGNLHEWVADPDGSFLGGYYLDTKQNGEGCSYKTSVHGPVYHDYSTGFRCCAAPKGR